MPNQLSALAADFSPSKPPVPNTSAPPLCPYFASGTCSFGQNCRNRHELAENARVGEEEDEGQCENKTDPGFESMHASREIIRTLSHSYEQRELSSATVTFTDGGQVSKIVLQSETSSIQIINLPIDVEPSWIVDLLGSLGFTFNASDAEILISSRNSTSIATVRFDTPEAGKLVMDRFNTAADPGDIGDVSIKEIQPLAESGTWLETGSVTCAWPKPTRRARLTYYDDIQMRLAGIHFSGLDHSHFQRSGNPITCVSLPTDHALSRYRPQLELVGLDTAITPFDIEYHLGLFHRPQKIRFRDSLWTCPYDRALEEIKGVLKDVGPLQSFDISCSGSKAKYVVRATYLASRNAARAVRILNDSCIEGVGMLSLKHIRTMKFKILTKISDAIKTQLNHIVESNSGKLWMRIAKLKTSSSIIRLNSTHVEATKILAGAKVMVERLLAGTPIVDDGTALWHSFFQVPAALAYFAGLSRANELYLHRDDRKRQLVFYGGTSTSRGSVQRSLLAKVRSLDKPRYKIALSKDQLTILLHGAMSTVQSILGIKASLDIKSRALTINGSENDFRIARFIIFGEDMQDEEQDAEQPEQPKPDIGDCVTCWSQNEDSILLTCGHTYCKQCLKSQATAAGEGDKGIPLRCQGEGSKCQQIIALNDLHCGLPLADYENLLKSSFMSYVRVRPAEYQYCPTPDCTSVYRPSDLNTSRVFRCTQCLVIICTSCRTISHPGLTCRAHQQRLAADVDFQAYVDDPANGTKTCPKCETNIEKTEGCNHMTCLACKAHICWVCREAFVDSPARGGAQQCEEHLVKVHGGIFGAEVEDIAESGSDDEGSADNEGRADDEARDHDQGWDEGGNNNEIEPRYDVVYGIYSDSDDDDYW